MRGYMRGLLLGGGRNIQCVEEYLAFPQVATVPDRLSAKAPSKACAEGAKRSFISGFNLQFRGFPAPAVACVA
jgi:hypothetical protein